MVSIYIYLIVTTLPLYSEYCVPDAVLIAYKHRCHGVRAIVPIIPLRRLRLEEEE